MAEKILFVYWGRRGPISQFVLELARLGDAGTIFSVSRQNELFPEIEATGASLAPVSTFRGVAGALFGLPKLPALRRLLARTVRENGIGTTVVLMSHVWTPLVASAVRRAGSRYVAVVHDADPHPGDATGLVNSWLLRDAKQADRIVTLSAHVAGRLEALGFSRARITTLFHPALGAAAPAETKRHAPPRFLFFGRILRYKGLPLFVEACEMLRREGLAFDASVVGEGEIGPERARLDALGAEIVNRWVGHEEIAPILAKADAIVLPCLEASQSGVASTALGHGLPVIATPVGGLAEQVRHGETGLLAKAVSAEAVAAEMRRFLADPALAGRLAAASRREAADLSMGHFLDALRRLD